MDLTLALDALKDVVVYKHEFCFLSPGKRNSLIKLGIALCKTVGPEATAAHCEFIREDRLMHDVVPISSRTRARGKSN